MGQLVAMAGWKDKKAAEVSAAPTLACPQCDTECAAINVEADGTTAYRCSGHGHRTLSWRIAASGEMLRGLKGKKRCY